jgi:hypothetical protein
MDGLIRRVHIMTDGREREPRGDEPFLIVERAGEFEYTWTASELKPPGEWTRCGSSFGGDATNWIRLARAPLTKADKDFWRD